MAKVKNKRNAGAADRANQKRKAEANKKKLNPFEVHINREKHHVLGKKSKHDRGLPGVSRAKAVQKRKETLGTEMKLMHKSNTFIDKRIGEKDNALSAEDRMVARFAAERAKQHGRKNIYNLADDEVLTHRGQTLEQIEKFDDPRSDEEDEAGFKGLDDDFVSEGHFGGGVLSKSDKDGAKSHKDLIEQLIAESKKRKVEKQKEKEQTLDLTEKLDSEWKDLQPVVFKRARVDEESAIDKVLGKVEKNSQDYDKMMRELRFEKRGTPSDAIKTDEKLEREEQERIAQLEKERERRMMGDHEVSTQPTNKHRSADDLDDNFQLDDEQDFMLAYDKDGKPLVPDHIFKANSVPNSNKQFDGGLTESSDDDEEEKGKSEDEESEDSDESEEQEMKSDKEESKTEVRGEKKEKSILFKDSASSEDDVSDGDSDSEMAPTPTKEISKESSKESKVKEIKDKAESSDDSESSDNEEVKPNKETLNNSNKVIESHKKTKSDDSDASSSEIGDIKNKINGTNFIQNGKIESDDDTEDDDENDDEGDDNDKEEIINKIENNKKTKVSQDSESEEDSSDESETQSQKGNNVQNKLLKMGKQKKLIGDSDVDEENEDDDDEHLKSFLGKTTEYEKIKKLLSDKTPSQQSTVLQKLIKSYDPSLGENNKELLSRLFANMLQYVNDLFTNLKDEGEIMKSFLILDKIAPYFYDINQINKVSSRKFFAELLTEKHEEYKKQPKKVPDLDTLVFFKLISLLYPTSDFRHPITTPSLTFMSQVLTTCKFRDAYSISRGMFVTTLILEYTTLSKRYVPAAVNFIRGVLYLSAKTTILNPIQVVPPFRLHKDQKILILEDDCSKRDAGWKMALRDLVAESIDNNFKIRTLLNATLMLKDFFDNCNEMEAQECIFEPHIQLLSRLELELYPKKVARTIEGIVKYMKDTLEVKTYKPLSNEKPKPKTLRLYEPDIQEVFTGSKSSKLSREMAERQRLQHRYKREMKGALREIRRDKAYIASVKIREKIQSDNIRKDKVKQIYKDASIQQGELNKLKRGK